MKLILAFAICSLIAIGRVQGATSFFDGTFPSSVWKQVRAGCGSVAEPTFGTPFAEAGNPKPSWLVTTGIPNDRSSLIQIFWNTNTVFNPQSQGAITSIDYSLDSILGTVSEAPISIRPALRQSNNWYVGPAFTPGGSWTRHDAVMLAASDFGFANPANCQVVVSQNPDFSPAGSTIDFGFAVVHASCDGCSGPLRTLFIDNWSVKINPDRGSPIRWTRQNSGTTNILADAIHAQNRFVAVGSEGIVVTSTNGELWSAQASVSTNDLLSVTYGAGRLVAVGNGGTILTSTNALVWIPAVSGTSNALLHVAFGESRFVAVGLGGKIMTSEDSTTWIERISNTQADLYGVAYGLGKFVAVGDFVEIVNIGGNPARITRNRVLTSVDGIVWGEGETDFSDSLALRAVAYGKAGFRVVSQITISGIPFAGGPFIGSEDGATWRRIASGVGVPFSNLGVGNGTYLASGSLGDTAFSTDGFQWNLQRLVSDEPLSAVAFGRDRFLVVGTGGTILLSEPIIVMRTPRVVNAAEFEIEVTGPAQGQYNIQISPNLSVWQTMTNIVTTNSPFLFRHKVPSNGASAFFRAVLE